MFWLEEVKKARDRGLVLAAVAVAVAVAADVAPAVAVAADVSPGEAAVGPVVAELPVEHAATINRTAADSAIGACTVFM
jgi:hypothetical protein